MTVVDDILSTGPRTSSTATKLLPLFDRVVLRRKRAETVTAGGLHLPEKAIEKSNLAEVVAVGPGQLDGDEHLPMQTRLGDVVLIGKWGGDLVTVDGEELLIVKESDIFAIVEPAI
jgi:chaperonin GroES